jgi:hypothetical protein
VFIVGNSDGNIKARSVPITREEWTILCVAIVATEQIDHHGLSLFSVCTLSIRQESFHPLRGTVKHGMKQEDGMGKAACAEASHLINSVDLFVFTDNRIR